MSGGGLAWRGFRLHDARTSLTLSNMTISASTRAAFMEMLAGTECTAAESTTHHFYSSVVHCSSCNPAARIKEHPPLRQ